LFEQFSVFNRGPHHLFSVAAMDRRGFGFLVMLVQLPRITVPIFLYRSPYSASGGWSDHRHMEDGNYDATIDSSLR
jgi:hypothetical protein